MSDALKADLEAGYGFDDDAIILGRGLVPTLDDTVNEVYVQAPLAMLNKHGLIAGATGTGKTKTLQVFAEQLSRAGVPVFLADLKGEGLSILLSESDSTHSFDLLDALYVIERGRVTPKALEGVA